MLMPITVSISIAIRPACIATPSHSSLLKATHPYSAHKADVREKSLAGLPRMHVCVFVCMSVLGQNTPGKQRSGGVGWESIPASGSHRSTAGNRHAHLPAWRPLGMGAALHAAHRSTSRPKHQTTCAFK
jgi:hypothetical protein